MTHATQTVTATPTGAAARSAFQVLEAPPDRAAQPPLATLACLRCHLLGRRRLTCSKVDACRKPPRFHPIGSILLAGWVAGAVAFLVAIS